MLHFLIWVAGAIATAYVILEVIGLFVRANHAGRRAFDGFRASHGAAITIDVTPLPGPGSERCC
ncbi:MAG: hypothetical protein ACE5FL_03395 [Myxococcota bacterium]